MDAFSHDLLQITTEPSDSNTIVTENLLNRIERLEKRLAVQELYVDEIVDNVEDMAAQMLDSFKQIETKIIAINRRFIRFFCCVYPVILSLLKKAYGFYSHDYMSFGESRKLVNGALGCWSWKDVDSVVGDKPNMLDYLAKNVLGIQIPRNPRIIQGIDIQDGDKIAIIDERGGYGDKYRTATLEEVTRWKAEEQEFFESMV